MNRKLFLAAGLVACLGLFSACDDDSSKEKNLCGNGVIDTGEICDGTNIPASAKVCDEGQEVDDASKFTCNASCKVDVGAGACKAAAEDLCGNGQIDGAEKCDKEAFAEGAKVCGEGQEVDDASKFTCDASCNVLVGEGACKAVAACNKNGVLDAGEDCDGEKFAEGKQVCPDGQVEVAEPTYVCDDRCKVVTTGACENPPANLLFSEVLYTFDAEMNNIAIAYEIHNLGGEINLKGCRIQGVDNNEALVNYTLAEGDSKIALSEADKTLAKDGVFVLCVQEAADKIPTEILEKCDLKYTAESVDSVGDFTLINNPSGGVDNSDAVVIVCEKDTVVTVYDSFEYSSGSLQYIGDNLQRICTDKGTGNSSATAVADMWVSIESNGLGTYACSAKPST